MSEGTFALTLRGETLLLHPDRALSWPSRRLLVVADTHFGKSHVFGHHGIAVPAGPDAMDRARIDRLLLATAAQRLLILGDFLHGPLPADSLAARELDQWLQELAPVQVQLVTGNHDRTARNGWQASTHWQGAALNEGPFWFVHDAEDQGNAPTDAYRIAGHIHPTVALGRSRSRLRVPVFWERLDALVLPSFGSFTGGYRIEPAAGGRVFVAGTAAVRELLWASPSRKPQN